MLNMKNFSSRLIRRIIIKAKIRSAVVIIKKPGRHTCVYQAQAERNHARDGNAAESGFSGALPHTAYRLLLSFFDNNSPQWGNCAIIYLDVF